MQYSSSDKRTIWNRNWNLDFVFRLSFSWVNFCIILIWIYIFSLKTHAFWRCDCGCCLIPFCINDTKDANHFCPNCAAPIGQKRFLNIWKPCFINSYLFDLISSFLLLIFLKFKSLKIYLFFMFFFIFQHIIFYFL